MKSKILFGWHVVSNKFHIAVLGYTNNIPDMKSYITLCPMSGYNFLNLEDLKSNSYIYPNGTYLLDHNIKFNYDSICKDCIKLFRKSNPNEKLKFEFIKIKLGVK